MRRWLTSRLYRKMVLSHIGMLIIFLMLSFMAIHLTFGSSIRDALHKRFVAQTGVLYRHLREDLQERKDAYLQTLPNQRPPATTPTQRIPAARLPKPNKPVTPRLRVLNKPVSQPSSKPAARTLNPSSKPAAGLSATQPSRRAVAPARAAPETSSASTQPVQATHDEKKPAKMPRAGTFGAIRQALAPTLSLLRKRVQEAALLLGAYIVVKDRQGRCLMEARPLRRWGRRCPGGKARCLQKRAVGDSYARKRPKKPVASKTRVSPRRDVLAGVDYWESPLGLCRPRWYAAWRKRRHRRARRPGMFSRWFQPWRLRFQRWREARRKRWRKRNKHRPIMRTYPLEGGRLQISYHLLFPFSPSGGKVILFGYLAAVFLGIALMAIMVSRSITRPLRDLREVVEQIRKGKLEQVVPVKGHDEIGELATTIEEMRETLIALGKEREVLISDASHEIRTPLARIRTVAESVADGLMREDDRLTQAMEGICKQVDEVGQLFGDLLDLARFDLPDRQRLQCATLDTAQLMRELKRTLEPAADAQDVKLILEPWEGDLPSLEADLRRLRQVFNNLIQNAIRYSPEGGEIRLEVAAEKETLCFRISDQGPGIPEAEREKIFERLYRLDPSRSRQTGGQGLGLAIVKKIIRAHHGQVGVTDAAGGGACFWLRLPIKQPT